MREEKIRIMNSLMDMQSERGFIGRAWQKISGDAIMKMISFVEPEDLSRKTLDGIYNNGTDTIIPFLREEAPLQNGTYVYTLDGRVKVESIFT